MPAPLTTPPRASVTAPLADFTSRDRQRARRMLAAAILLLALVLRVALIVIKGGATHFSDTGEYDAAARALLGGQAYAIPRAPLYPAWMALAYALFGVGNYAAVRWLQLPLGLAVVALTGRLGTQVGGRRIGSVAMLLAAISPTLVYTTSMLYPVVLMTLLAVAALLLAIAWVRSGSMAPCLALGLVVAGLFLADPIGAVPALALVIWGIAQRGRSPARWLQGALVLAVAAGAVFAAQPRSSTAARGSGFVAKAEYVLWVSRHDAQAVGGHRVDDGEATFAPIPVSALLRRELRLGGSQPAAYLHDVGFEFVHFFAPEPDRLQTHNVFTGRAARMVVAGFFWPVLLLALAGVFASRVRVRDRALLAIAPLATAATYAWFFTQMRYRVPTEPAILTLTAIGIMAMVRKWRHATHRVS